MISSYQIVLGIIKIKPRFVRQQVMFVPGCAFLPDPEAPSSYVRASYSLASEEQIDQVSVFVRVCMCVCVCVCVSESHIHVNILLDLGITASM